MSEDNTPPLALPPGVDRVADLGTLLTLKETAERLGVSPKTVRRMVTRGDFLGAHQVPMPGGKGTQWVIPYSEIVKHENQVTQEKASRPENASAQELAELRAQVDRLQAELDTQRALATDRAYQLEQLHLTVRLSLKAGEEPPKRRLFGRRSGNWCCY